MKIVHILFLLVVFIVEIPKTYALSSSGIVEQVSDGDTIRATIDGRSFSIRLQCIDSPEKVDNPKLTRDAERSGQSKAKLIEAGKSSMFFLRGLIKKGDTLSLEYGPEKFDHYGRVLAYVYLEDGKFLNKFLVSEGYAGVVCFPPNDTHGDVLLEEAHRAKRESKGLWHTGVELPLFLKRNPSVNSKNHAK